jgi:hypothetical protein
MPNTLMMMPASAAIAAARRTKPKRVFRRPYPAMALTGGESSAATNGLGTNRKRPSGACQKRANTYRRFLQRSVAGCRLAMLFNPGKSSGFPLFLLVGVRGFEPPAPASRKQFS